MSFAASLLALQRHARSDDAPLELMIERYNEIADVLRKRYQLRNIPPIAPTGSRPELRFLVDQAVAALT
jgi:hypothetical protein